jgi:hypothetical protein
MDQSNASNIEVSGSVMTGLMERPLDAPVGEVNAQALRQTTFGADVTFRWRPPERGLYNSFILQAEFMAQRNDNVQVTSVPSPIQLDDYAGLYVFGRYQISRRGYLGARFDSLDDPAFGGERTNAYSGYYEFFPSEFSKLLAKFERVNTSGQAAFNRFLIQATFALGPHRPHPF